METPKSFAESFLALTGYRPFPWQVRLHDEWFAKGKTPSDCTLPTGVGKTAALPIWLIGLAGGAPLPRRLAYVVNRRTVVDQATNEAVRMLGLIQEPATAGEHEGTICCLRDALGRLTGDASRIPLAVSTLRGQFADNGEWSVDPARPAIIIGTVDMIGSRLLFSGYRRGFKHRPLHAGFLGQDTLLVHDEAQLEPAFQDLLGTIQKCKDFRTFRVMQLTATARTQSDQNQFVLQEDDFKHQVIRQRLGARKTLELHADDEKKTAETIACLALRRAELDPDRAILAYLRTVEAVKWVADRLSKAHGKTQVEQLTGTLRGKERDELVRKPVFQRFLSPSNRDHDVTPAEATVFLVCTSAGEVGLDISADHLVCDLTTFDSMAQRFGRVNRYGKGDANIDAVHPDSFSDSGASKEYEARREKTLALLRRLNGDASPKAIGELPLPDRIAGFSPTPKILDATDILFDAWALTSLCKPLTGLDAMPGRPPVADWLHGVAEWQPPETQVAWRSEVQWLTGDLLETYQPEDLLDVYPLKPHELLKDNSKRVLEELKEIAKRLEENSDDNNVRKIPVWIQDDRGVEVTGLHELIEGKEDAIANRTLILPPFAGGLRRGMLGGTSGEADDVADDWSDEHGRKRRVRVWDDEVPEDRRMRPVRSAIDLDAEAEHRRDVGDAEEADVARAANVPPPAGRLWKWYALPRWSDDDGSRAAFEPILLDVHGADVHQEIERIVNVLGLANSPEGRALAFAAEAHDLGKDRAVWQRSIRNDKYPKRVLAKSGQRRPPRDLSSYRHEFGSVLDVLSLADTGGPLAEKWVRLSELEQDLALHFIASHHGRARPHFPPDEAFDPERSSSQAAEAAREVPLRFARLQRKYGRWGLAYLESILRAADAAASANPSDTLTGSNASPVKVGAAEGSR